MKAVFLLTALLGCISPLPAAPVPAGGKGLPTGTFGNANRQLPVYFEPEGGKFVSRSPWGTIAIRSNCATIDAGASPVTMRMVGAKPDSAPEPMDRMPSKSHYFVGGDSSKWRTDIPHFRKIRYKNIYPGIDLLYYGIDHMLEYDFVVSPGSTYSVIELAFEGADAIRTAHNGDLLVESKGRTIRQHQPRVYQLVSGVRQEVAGAYRIDGDRVRFALGEYDRSRALVIDPVIQYAAYFGDAGYDAGVAIVADSSGATYISGLTTSIQLPTTRESAQRDNGGATDAFVAKFSPYGDLAWITYFGGAGTEAGLGVAVDTSGSAYLSGFTTSRTLPLRRPLQPAFGGGELDAFLVKFSPGGNEILYSTYIGGSGDDYGNGVAVDAEGSAYLTGWTRSTDFPRRGEYQQNSAGGGGDTFVTKVGTTGQIVYSTYVGGNGDDLATGIAVDAQGAAYVTGFSSSSFFPLARAVQTSNAGKYDAFVYKLTPAGNDLAYSTFLGGSEDDRAQRIVVDGSGSAYVSGDTKSADFPVRGGAQPAIGGGVDAFVFKLTPRGDAVAYSSLLGGAGDDYASGIKVDSAGSVYLSGWTNSKNFPVRNAAQATYGGGLNDGFVARLAPAGNALLYATYLGGSGEDKAYDVAVERSGVVDVTGHTDSTNFPGATNARSGAAADVFLAKLSADTSSVLLSAAPASLELEVRAGAPVPQAASLTVMSTGQPVTFVASSTESWLDVTPERAVTGTTIAVSFDTTNLAPGTYHDEISVSGPAALEPIRIPVTLTVTAGPPRVASGGIVNAATFVSGPIAPGEVITVFGSGLGPATPVSGASADGSLATSVADTRLLIDGLPVPLLSLQDRQLSAIVPYSVAGRGIVSVEVEKDGRRSDPAAAAVAFSAPGVFTVDSSGKGQAAAYNQDGSANSSSNPASQGSIVVLYTTGEGLLNTSVNEGRPWPGSAAPAQPVSVRVGDLPAEVVYAGTIPGGIPGVMQVNVRIPAQAASGSAPVVLTVGANSSPAVTVAIR